ncbi:hypothetical protein OBBRIDRAFT_256970 [Obba rivulosa]|uniref:Uncharacterized protein n=1 Tax=Obba rivulosa TaxID=1052685 RepID=A0A8E2AKI0_9APHY|nr:hypothetical protein OBBRIDRAFT_256970 [Obba rivulosa]
MLSFRPRVRKVGHRSSRVPKCHVFCLGSLRHTATLMCSAPPAEIRPRAAASRMKTGSSRSALWSRRLVAGRRYRH